MNLHPRLALIAALVLAAASFPLSDVSAHQCESIVQESPHNPSNPDTGCDGSDCPSNAGTLPHDHRNTVPPAHCRNDGPPPPPPSGGCTGKNHGQSKTHGQGPGGGPAPASTRHAGAPELTEELLALCHNVRLATVSGHAPCPYEPTHVYVGGGSVGAEVKTANTGDLSFGFVTVWETNAADCDGDGVPADYDGSFDFGIGGGFFGYGAWAHETTCNFGLQIFGGSVTVNDHTFGSDIWLKIGADDMNGPDLTPDPVTGEPGCTTSGSITPGDPATDPTADADDCLTPPQHGSGWTCGAGGDGGYWVFLNSVYALEAGSVTVGNPAICGTIAAS